MFSLQPLSEVVRGQFEGLELHIGCGIQIEYQSVRIVDSIDTRAPWVDLYGTHLDDFEKTLFVLYIEVLIALSFMEELESMHVRAETFSWVALIEKLVPYAGRAAQKTQRMPRHPREHVRRHGRIVFSQFAFCNM